MSSVEKRPRDDDSDDDMFAVDSNDSNKRPRTDDLAIVVHPTINQSNKQAIDLTSDKLPAPVLQLKGHTRAVNVCRFNHIGDVLATAADDNEIKLWPLFNQSNQAISQSEESITPLPSPVTGHSRAILDFAWSNNSQSFVSASADETACLVDCSTMSRLKRWRHHFGPVNACCYDGDTVLTASDDRRALMYDIREPRMYRSKIDSSFQLLAAVLSINTNSLYIAGVESIIYHYDIRALTQPLNQLSGHTSSVTSLQLGADDTALLSYSADSLVKLWNVRPFSDQPDRCLNTLTGARNDAQSDGVLCRARISPDASFIAAGSADRTVCIWDASSGELTARLPGHKGKVHDVDWHPALPIIASASGDKTVIVGEL